MLLGNFTLASQVRLTLYLAETFCEDKSQVNLGQGQVKRKYANFIPCLANHKQKSHLHTEDAYNNRFVFQISKKKMSS